MHIPSALTFLAATSSLVAAAPSVIRIRSDDVILYGQGRYTIMKRDDVKELQQYRHNGTVPPMPAYLNPGLPTINGTKLARHLGKRGSETILLPNPATRFLGWDVVMSQVVQGPAAVTVTTGYSIANSITVGSSTDFTLVKDYLSTTLSIDYGTTWTSSQTQMLKADVDAGKYGAFVSNPWTNRQSGNVWSGAIGTEGTLSPYQGDSFEGKGYGDMQWVDGFVALCQGDSLPLKRCLGEGTL
ncbi:hypothetical protein P280DRAFT_462950 [Massarina eburnea CBS 473.64]|uniref:Celp0028 effector like protein n=1 Tax=Massarina eburnea CBS 473.64 TaxID=1395130 RepID=A0A6A6RI69_9PLEO|nr:hypothetical protein P280DRAFT_462950 [Massarina eburnea CBS 473.64]